MYVSVSKSGALLVVLILTSWSGRGHAEAVLDKSASALRSFAKNCTSQPKPPPKAAPTPKADAPPGEPKAPEASAPTVAPTEKEGVAKSPEKAATKANPTVSEAVKPKATEPAKEPVKPSVAAKTEEVPPAPRAVEAPKLDPKVVTEAVARLGETLNRVATSFSLSGALKRANNEVDAVASTLEAFWKKAEQQAREQRSQAGPRKTVVELFLDQPEIKLATGRASDLIKEFAKVREKFVASVALSMLTATRAANEMPAASKGAGDNAEALPLLLSWRGMVQKAENVAKKLGMAPADVVVALGSRGGSKESKEVERLLVVHTEAVPVEKRAEVVSEVKALAEDLAPRRKGNEELSAVVVSEALDRIVEATPAPKATPAERTAKTAPETTEPARADLTPTAKEKKAGEELAVDARDFSRRVTENVDRAVKVEGRGESLKLTPRATPEAKVAKQELGKMFTRPSDYLNLAAHVAPEQGRKMVIAPTEASRDGKVEMQIAPSTVPANQPGKPAQVASGPVPATAPVVDVSSPAVQLTPSLLAPSRDTLVPTSRLAFNANGPTSDALLHLAKSNVQGDDGLGRSANGSPWRAPSSSQLLASNEGSASGARPSVGSLDSAVRSTSGPAAESRFESGTSDRFGGNSGVSRQSSADAKWNGMKRPPERPGSFGAKATSDLTKQLLALGKRQAEQSIAGREKSNPSQRGPSLPARRFENVDSSEAKTNTATPTPVPSAPPIAKSNVTAAVGPTTAAGGDNVIVPPQVGGSWLAPVKAMFPTTVSAAQSSGLFDGPSAKTSPNRPGYESRGIAVDAPKVESSVAVTRESQTKYDGMGAVVSETTTTIEKNRADGRVLKTTSKKSEKGPSGTNLTEEIVTMVDPDVPGQTRRTETTVVTSATGRVLSRRLVVITFNARGRTISREERTTKDGSIAIIKTLYDDTGAQRSVVRRTEPVRSDGELVSSNLAF